jgi:hypothetical protein
MSLSKIILSQKPLETFEIFMDRMLCVIQIAANGFPGLEVEKRASRTFLAKGGHKSSISYLFFSPLYG